MLFVGWFGPRGLASVVFGLLALEALGESAAKPAITVIAFTVLLSVLAHGLSADPLARGVQGSLLQRVAHAGPQHEHGAVGGAQQPGQVELLQDRLPVRPDDRPELRRQRGGRRPLRRAWPGYRSAMMPRPCPAMAARVGASWREAKAFTCRVRIRAMPASTATISAAGTITDMACTAARRLMRRSWPGW